jgi:predicted RecA/RadA family phage recombinase
MNLSFHSGNRIDWVNTTGVTVKSGGVVVLVSGASGFIGIALNDIAAGATGSLCVGGYPEGSYQLAKKSGDVFTPGQIVYWDVTNKRLTVTATLNTKAGRVDGAYASAAVLAFVLVNRG